MQDPIANLTIATRFNGPPASGNGGYVCGLLAAYVDGPAVVTLRTPPPLERPLAVTGAAQGLRLHDGDTLVAELEPGHVDVTPPAVVSVDAAERAIAGYPGFAGHLFPTCFVCGPERAPGDGLRLFPGPVPGTPVAAAPWRPAHDLSSAGGHVAPEFVWAALDCPSYFGSISGTAAVLGQLSVTTHGPVRAGEPHVVLGWHRGSEGRKHHAAAAITDAAGTVLAVATATWIELGTPPPR